MSWQEELRKLDEELASGRLSADDYRVRRDQVLSSAVNHGDNPAETPQQPGQDPNSTQVIAPVSPPHGTPQPNPQQNLGGSEATQVVSHWQTQQGQPPHAPHAPQPPQYHQPGLASPAGGFQQPGPVSPAGGMPLPPQQAHPWNAPEADQSPPWGGSDLPPLPPATHQDGSGQGADSFETSSGGGKKVLVIVGVVALVAALGVGSWLLFFNGSGDDDKQAGPGPSSSVAPTSTVPPKDDLEIAALPGGPGERTDISMFEDVKANQVLTEDENEIYEEAGAGKARMAVAELPSGADAVILTVETSSEDAASTAVEDLVELQEKNGMDPYDGTLPTGVQGTQIDKTDSFPAAARAHYAHGKTVVRIQVSAPKLSEVGPSFEEIIATQLQALSADG